MSDDSTARLARITFSERNPQKDVFREVDLRAKLRMSADSKLDYKTAVKQTFLADEDLQREWLDTTPPLRHNQ